MFTRTALSSVSAVRRSVLYSHRSTATLCATGKPNALAQTSRLVTVVNAIPHSQTSKPKFAQDLNKQSSRHLHQKNRECRDCVRGQQGKCRLMTLSAAQPQQVERATKETTSQSSHLSCIVDRGAFDERYFQHTTGSNVKDMEVVSEGKNVQIVWEDGKVSRFHSLWLLDTCFCQKCRCDYSGQSIVSHHELPDDPRIATAVDDGAGCLVVKWAGEQSGHTSVFPLKFLKGSCYSKESLAERRKAIAMTYPKDGVIPRFQFHDVMSSMESLYSWVLTLSERGVALMEGVPCVPGMVEKVVQRVADYPQHTVYGRTQRLRHEQTPVDLGFTNNKLSMHTDMMVYESPPGISNIHCLRFDDSVPGGETVLLDRFEVAESFREKFPEDFHILTQVPITIQTVHYKRSWPIHMKFKRPMISVNEYGDVIGVFWHPHMMGPLQAEEELVEPFFKAYKRFAEYLNSFPHTYQHRLRNGELISFNQRRLLHARNGFDSSKGVRDLELCYVEISEFKSCAQVLSNLIGDGRPVARLGDMDWQ